MPYQVVQPQIDIDVTLSYIAFVVRAIGRDFAYAVPFSPRFSTNSLAEYNTRITWGDTEPQPTYADILANYVAAWTWGHSVTDTERLDNIENYLLTALPLDISNVSPLKTVSYPARALDTVFRPSTTKDTLAVYSEQIVATSSLAGGQLGSVILRIADDAAFTTGVQDVSKATNGQTGTLVIGLNLVQTFTSPLVGIIPKNKYAMLVSVDTTGAPVQTFVLGQETQF